MINQIDRINRFFENKDGIKKMNSRIKELQNNKDYFCVSRSSFNGQIQIGYLIFINSFNGEKELFSFPLMWSKEPIF